MSRQAAKTTEEVSTTRWVKTTVFVLILVLSASPGRWLVRAHHFQGYCSPCGVCSVVCRGRQKSGFLAGGVFFNSRDIGFERTLGSAAGDLQLPVCRRVSVSAH